MKGSVFYIVAWITMRSSFQSEAKFLFRFWSSFHITFIWLTNANEQNPNLGFIGRDLTPADRYIRSNVEFISINHYVFW